MPCFAVIKMPETSIVGMSRIFTDQTFLVFGQNKQSVILIV